MIEMRSGRLTEGCDIWARLIGSGGEASLRHRSDVRFGTISIRLRVKSSHFPFASDHRDEEPAEALRA